MNQGVAIYGWELGYESRWNQLKESSDQEGEGTADHVSLLESRKSEGSRQGNPRRGKP